MNDLPSLLLCVLLLASPVSAQERNPFAWTSGAKVANTVSWLTVAGNLAGDTVHSFKAEDKKRAFGCQALRMGVTIGAAELTKAFVHRRRPDGSDDKSFFSEHTAIAFAATGWRVQFSVPLALGTGYLRPAANKHYMSDVIVGGLVGIAAAQICR